MKRIMLGLVLLTAGLLSPTAKAQINVNIGSQPVWGPVGYDYVDYYYMPDIEVYYNVPRRQFVYFDMGRWVFSTSLPYRCRNYDLYRGYKVVVNRRDAYRYWNDDRVRYSNYRNWRGSPQMIIRDRTNYRPSQRVVYQNEPRRTVYNRTTTVYVNDRNSKYKKYERNNRDDYRKYNDRGNRGNGHGHGRGH